MANTWRFQVTFDVHDQGDGASHAHLSEDFTIPGNVDVLRLAVMGEP